MKLAFHKFKLFGFWYTLPPTPLPVTFLSLALPSASIARVAEVTQLPIKLTDKPHLIAPIRDSSSDSDLDSDVNSESVPDSCSDAFAVLPRVRPYFALTRQQQRRPRQIATASMHFVFLLRFAYVFYISALCFSFFLYFFSFCSSLHCFARFTVLLLSSFALSSHV